MELHYTGPEISHGDPFVWQVKFIWSPGFPISIKNGRFHIVSFAAVVEINKRIIQFLIHIAQANPIR